MLKTTILLVFIIINTAVVYSQDLDGKWKGTLSDYAPLSSVYQIFIDFFKLSDSTYQAYSKVVSKNGDTSIYLLTGSLLRKNTLLLKQIKVIKPFLGGHYPMCVQTFELLYDMRKNRTTLNGYWTTKDGTCGNGLIFLKKQL